MLKIRFYPLVLLLLCASVWSCKKDAQNFNYTELNELTINAKDAFMVTQFDSLTIDPEIIQSKPSGETFTYQWKIYPYTAVEGIGPQVISTDKALKTVISLPPLQVAYNLEYKVTNTSNGVSAFKTFRIQVSSVFRDGWLVCNSSGGKAQLGFIRSDYKVFYTPAESVNQTVYQGDAVGAYAYSNLDGSQFGVTFFTDNGNYQFNANDFLQIGKPATDFKPVRDKFSFAPSMFRTEVFVINNGNLYAASLWDQSLNVTYTERLPGDYEMFPKVIASTLFTTYFYDNKNKRFMYASGSFSLIPSFGSSTDPFDMSDTRMQMVGAMEGAKTTGSQEYFFIMQGSNGDRYLYSLSGGTPELNQRILNSAEISSAHSFAASLELRQMYYATDNRIYLYDILANSSRLLYTFPSGTRIKQMQIPQTDSRTLVVAANNGTSGEVYFFELTSLGNFTGGSYIKKIDGFGEITNLAHRELN